MDELVRSLERNRDEFLATAARFSDDVTGLSLGEGDWTIWGVTAHLAAAEWQLRRMAEIIAENPGFEFQPFDRDTVNAQSVARYDGKTLSELLEEWKANRQRTIDFAGRLSAAQLAGTVLHPVYGEIGPQNPIERTIWHTTDHLAHIRATLRRAGR